MINPETKQLIVQTTSSNDRDKIVFMKNRKSSLVRWNNHLLKSKIVKLMNWDLSHSRYRVEGKYVPEDKLLLFNLQEAQIR